ncbi:hypothetical protein [Phyllobacterium salinisoli]|uniref:hypothetical protein n=1 Tax=Phyllobacterium salinisoli TaxID=1899321 RepID=UPI00190F43CC
MLGSLFGGLFGGGGFKTTPGAGLFADGGYTGQGGKYAPAGVVHKGEYVFDQASVKAAGGPAALDAVRRGLKGYAGGGAVGMPSMRAPRMPDLKAIKAANSNTPTFSPTWNIDARGADSAAVARLEQVVAKQNNEFSARVVTTVRQAISTRNL